MIKVLYNELDGPEGVTLRLEAAGHAGRTSSAPVPAP